MATLFFDTSALVKRYAEEPGTVAVDKLIENDESTIAITQITVVEMTSAFRRKHNRGAIDEETVVGLVYAFFEEALNEFAILPMSDALFEWPFELILEDDLRTLDSLQLAAALAFADAREEVTFVCADEALVSVARSRGLEALDPLEASPDD